MAGNRSSLSHVEAKIMQGLMSAKESLLSELVPLWSSLYGADSNVVDDRCQSVLTAVQDMFKEMVEEEKDIEKELLNKHTSLLDEAAQLENELSITVDRGCAVNNPLVKKMEILEENLKEYRIMKQSRMSKLKRLQDKEIEMSLILEEKTTHAFFNSVPSDEKLEEISSHLKILDNEIKVRREQYTGMRKKVMDLWESLKLKPMNEFETLVYENKLADKLGKENLEQLRILLAKLETIKLDMAEELENLKEELSTLWHRLQTEIKHKEKFLLKHSNLCVPTIEAFKEEIKVCTELKMKHIVSIVTSIRSELIDWWDKCHFGPEQRQLFTAFHIKDNITEEVLLHHEAEIEKMKKYFADNQECLNLIETRYELWEKMVDLEKKASDKDRLFKNRGGQLLLEEKERKQVQKDLPKVEKILDKLFDKYEETYGSPFLYDGENVKELFANQWAERNQQKENNKNSKKYVVTSQNVHSKSKLLTVTRSKTPIRNTTLKRKLECTPMNDLSKRSRSVDRKKKNVLATPGTGNKNANKEMDNDSSPASSVLSYSIFQNQIESADSGFNSTYDCKKLENKPKIVTKSTPTNRSKINTRQPPARSRLLSPKMRSKNTLLSTNKLTKNTAALTPISKDASKAILTRSRTQIQLTPHTPRHKLPFIF